MDRVVSGLYPADPSWTAADVRDPAGRDAFLGGTARRFYALGPDTTPKPAFTLGLDA